MRRAFTLIELLVVISIIAILIAILLPALRGSKYETKRMMCKSNMRQAAIGLISYSTDNRGSFPETPYGRWHPAMIAKIEATINTSGDGNYDHRDILRSYTGAELNDILKCPLADPWWFSDAQQADIDNYPMGTQNYTTTPYAFFYGKEPVTGPGLPDFWPRDQHMTGPERGFIPQGQTREFNILLADYTYAVGWGGPYLLTTHQPLDGRPSSDPFFNNYLPSAQYEVGEQSNSNFAATDGSVDSYWLDYDAATGDDYVNMNGYILPVRMTN